MSGIEWSYVPFDRTTYQPFYWESFRGTAGKVLEYAEENPMPKGRIYNNIMEIIDDFENAAGVISLSLDENEEFITWFEGLLEYIRE